MARDNGHSKSKPKPLSAISQTQRIVVTNKFLLSKLVYLIGHPKTLPFVQLGSFAQPCVFALPCGQSHADYYTVVHCPMGHGMLCMRPKPQSFVLFTALRL